MCKSFLSQKLLRFEVFFIFNTEIQNHLTIVYFTGRFVRRFLILDFSKNWEV